MNAPTAKPTRLVIDITGMTCDACVTTLQDRIGELDQVRAVRVDLADATAVIDTDSDDGTVAEQVRAAIEAAGYTVGRPAIVTRDRNVWFGAGAGVAVGVALWQAIDSFGGGITLTQATGSVLFALVAGLLAGATTCAALVGSLALTVAASDRHTHASSRAATQAKFHAGRVASFTVAGGLLGLTGAMLPAGWIQTLTWVAVVLVVLVAVRVSGLFPALSRVRLSLPTGTPRWAGRFGAGGVGAASVLVPCGITQVVALAAASSGSLGDGAVMLAAFAVGTIPGLVLFVAVPTFAGQRKPVIAGTAMAAVVLALGSVGLVGTLTAGTASGTGGVSAGQFMDMSPVHLDADGVVNVDIHVDGDGYTPSNVIVPAGYPVRINFDAATLLTCAAAPVLPDGETIALDHGVTEVNLGVLEAKVHTISCSMNMYHLDIDAR